MVKRPNTTTSGALRADRFNAEIGKLLRSKRKELGLTQVDIAHHVGVSQQQIVKYEKGVGRIPADNLTALCQRLNIDLGAVTFPFVLAGAGFADVATPPYAARDDDVAHLIKAFEAIRDKAVRRRVLDLVTALAEAEPTGAGRKRR